MKFCDTELDAPLNRADRFSLQTREKGIMMNAIAANGLQKSFGDVEALRGVNLRVDDGEFYALMGPNGSGKTTLVSILASVITPTSGKAEIFGRKPQEARNMIGFVPQGSFSSPMLTGRENLVYFAQLFGYSKNEAEKIASEQLLKMGLSEAADRLVSDYSGGMRKKLEVATALFPEVRLLILDEPSTGLDPSARKNFLGMIEEVNSTGVTVLCVTHIGEDAEIASKVGFMDEGVIIAEDKPEMLKRNSGLEKVLHAETSIKKEAIANVLVDYSDDRRILETEKGYRICCNNPEEAIPDISRQLDRLGCKLLRIETSSPSLEDVFYKLTDKSVRRV